MKSKVFAFIVAVMISTAALAGTINYNTTGSTLSCNGVAGCVQNTTTSVTLGGLTFTYNSGSGSNVATPSIINLGNIVSTGTGISVNVTGLLLTINVSPPTVTDVAVFWTQPATLLQLSVEPVVL